MFRTLIASAALSAALAGSASAATIFYDDFNADVQGAPSTLLNWTVEDPSIDVIGGSFHGFYPAEYGNYVDMTGSGDQGLAGRITTKLALNLVDGTEYIVSFLYGNNKNSNGVERLKIGLGNWGDYLDVAGAVPSFKKYVTRFTYDASVVGGVPYLTFADVGNSTGDYGGVIIDNVRVASVPLPAGGLMLLAALGGLAALRRRKTA